MNATNVQKLDSASFQEFISSGTPTLVDFWAPWCGPCRALEPVIESVANNLGEKAKVGKLNIDDHQDLAVKYGIASIPTILVFRNGEITDTLVGIRPQTDYEDALTD